MGQTRVMLIVAVLIIMGIGLIAIDAYAETRTLTTRILVTVRPDEPELRKAPDDVRDMYSKGTERTLNQRFVRLESPTETGLVLPRYTVMERL